MSVEFGASIKLDSKSALDQMRKFAAQTTEASKTLRQLQNETRATAQGLGGNVFRKYIDGTRRVSVQTERAVAAIHNQSKALSKLSDSEKSLISTVDKLNQKYDDTARAEARLTTVRKELRLVTAAGLKTQKEADAIYAKEAASIQKSTASYKERQAVLKKEAHLQSSQKKRLTEIQAKYNHVYAAELKERQLRKELNLLRRKQIITDMQYNTILAKQTKRIKEQTAHTIKMTSAQSRLAKTARLVSIYSRVLLGLYAGARLTGFVTDLEKTAEAVKLLDQKLVFLTGDNGAYAKFFAMTQDVGINMQAASKIVTRFSVVTNRAFSVDTINEWTATLVKSARATGTSTQEMSGALIQITQAMSAGRLMGDEYRSVTENLPLLTVALRDMFGESTLSLKELSSQGLITNDVMVEAFGRLEEMIQGFPDTTDTVTASIDRLSAAWDNFVSVAVQTDITKNTLNFLSDYATMYADVLKRNSEQQKLEEESALVFSYQNAQKAVEIETDKLKEMEAARKNSSFLFGVSDSDIEQQKTRLATLSKLVTHYGDKIEEGLAKIRTRYKLDQADKELQEERRLTAIYKERLKVVQLMEKLQKGKSVTTVNKKADLNINEIEASHKRFGEGAVGLDDEQYFIAYDAIEKAQKDSVNKILQTQVDANLRMRGFKTKFDIEDIEKELSHNSKLLEIEKKHADRVLQVRSAIEAGKEEARVGVSKELRQGISSKKGESLIGGLDEKRARLIKLETDKITNSISNMITEAEKASMVINKDMLGLLSMEQKGIIDKFNKSMDALNERYKKLGGHSGEQTIKYNLEVRALSKLRDLESLNAERNLNEGLENKYSEQTVALRKYQDSVRDLNTAKERLVVTDQEHAYQLRIINEEYDHQTRLAQSLSGELSTLDQVYSGLERGAINFMNNTETAYEFFTSSTEDLMDASVGLIIDHSKSAKDAFNDMIRSMLVDLQKLAIKRAIMGAFGNVGSTSFSSFSSTSVPTGGGSGVNTGFMTPGMTLDLSAKGNVYSGAGISAYSNKIVSKPTLFPFAKGTGLMGEAGPEAIMPLKRGSDGKLGIQTSGSGSSITVNNYSNSQVEAVTKTDKDGKEVVEIMVHEALSNMVQSGKFDTMLTPYNVTRTGRR